MRCAFEIGLPFLGNRRAVRQRAALDVCRRRDAVLRGGRRAMRATAMTMLRFMGRWCRCVLMSARMLGMRMPIECVVGAGCCAGVDGRGHAETQRRRSAEPHGRECRKQQTGDAGFASAQPLKHVDSAVHRSVTLEACAGDGKRRQRGQRSAAGRSCASRRLPVRATIAAKASTSAALVRKFTMQARRNCLLPITAFDR